MKSDVMRGVRRLFRLSELESDALMLIFTGMCNAEAAEVMHVKETSIRNYLYRAYLKLGTSNKMCALLVCIDSGAISIDELKEICRRGVARLNNIVSEESK